MTRTRELTLIGGPSNGTTVTVPAENREVTVPVLPDELPTLPGDGLPTRVIEPRTVTYIVHRYLNVAVTHAVNNLPTAEALNVIARTTGTDPGHLAVLILERIWEQRHGRTA